MLGSCARQDAPIKIQFNGVGELRTYIHLQELRATNGAQRRGDLAPVVIVTVIVAVVGTAGILNKLRQVNDTQDSGTRG
jgi:hypothetical protein